MGGWRDRAVPATCRGTRGKARTTTLNSASYMARDPATLEKALAALQQTIRAPDRLDARIVMSGQVPDDLQEDDFKTVGFTEDEARVLATVRRMLPQDLRFEYLKEQ